MNDDNSNQQILVCIDTGSFRKGVNITGEIWLDVAGFGFPSKHWSDFPVIILSWWVDALAKLSSGQSDGCECLFMDGSYSFEVSTQNEGFILRCYIDPYSAKKCQWEWAISLTELLRQVSDAAATIGKECQRLGWVTTDTVLLGSKSAYIASCLGPQS